MSGHVGPQVRLTALRMRIRTRPHFWPPHAKCLQQHDFTPRVLSPTLGQRRSFSVADGANGLLRCSEWLITNAHELTGAPWCVSIPLAALVVSAVIRAPMALYAHQKSRKRATLAPLIQAQAAMISRELRRKAVPDLRARVDEMVKKRRKKLVKAVTGSERGSMLGGFATLPIFISNFEVVRRMCGGPTGLLGTLVFGVSGAEKSTDAAVAMIPPDDLSASGSSATELAQSAASPETYVISPIAMEPSFATEGCLWFPNLLEADPLHVLPFVLSAILAMHMIPGSSEARRQLFGLSPVAGNKYATILGQAGMQRALQRLLLMLALAMGPLTMDLPAALHLYWLSSAVFSLAVGKGLKRGLPIPKNTIKPCQGVEVPLLRPRPGA